MYIPILKDRLFENKFMKDHKNLLVDNVKPLVEIITDKIGGKVYTNLEIINFFDRVLLDQYFYDIFTFDEDVYKPFDPNLVAFASDQRLITPKDYYDYLDILLECNHSEKAIPVLSFKAGRDFSIFGKNSLKTLFTKLFTECNQVAIRLSSNYFEEYIEDIIPFLRKNDYLMYDINQTPIESMHFDIEDLTEIKGDFKRVILHSPRDRKTKNGLYKDCSYTDLIDNAIRNDYKILGFDGFGDYAGLKDILPTGGGNGQGAALGLFFINNRNKFLSIMNSNTKIGTLGHKHVIDEAFGNYYNELNPTDDCPAMEYIKVTMKDKGKPGVWGQWKYITILRYISQIKKSL